MSTIKETNTGGTEALVYDGVPFIETSSEDDFDPSTGRIYIRTYSATKKATYGDATYTNVDANIQAIMRAGLKAWYEDLGCKVKVKAVSELMCEVTVETNNQNNTTNPPGSTAVVAEQVWDVVTEFDKPSLFGHWKVVKEMGQFAATGSHYVDSVTAADMIASKAYYKTTIEKAIKEGKSIADLNPTLAAYPIAQAVWEAMTRGTKDYFERRPVVQYTKKYPVDSWQAQFAAAVPINCVYAPSQLEYYFGVPSDVLSKLPSTATTTITNGMPVVTDDGNVPPNTTWGWMVTKDNRRISVWDKKFIITQELSGAYWSNIFYAHVTAHPTP